MIYSPWDMEHNILKLVILGKFLPFYPSLKTLKIKILKDEKNFSRYHHFTNVYKKWLEILSFYTYMCTLNEDHMIYGYWNIRIDRQKFFSFWAIFSLSAHKQPRKSKFWKNEKIPGYIIILHICIINDNHMMIDMARDRQNFLSFWTVFSPFTPYGPRKSKLWRNETNSWRYYHFANVYHKWQSYDIWFLRYAV